MKTKRWHGVPGVLSVEAAFDPDRLEWFDLATDDPLPAEVASVVGRDCDGADWCEIVLHFRASGYYDPGKTYGDPATCYPPEGSEERTLERVELIWDGGRKTRTTTGCKSKRLCEADARTVFDAYEEAVDGVELDSAESWEDGP